MEKSPWKKLSSKVVHKNPYYSIREDGVVKPDGEDGKYYVIQVVDSIAVIALTSKQKVILIKQYRYPIEESSWEVVGGSSSGEDPLVAAKRELQEETGLVAKKWQKVGLNYPYNGICNEKAHIFIAQELVETDKNAQKEDGITEVKKLSFAEIFKKIKEGKINDGQTISAITQVALHLGMIK